MNTFAHYRSHNKNYTGTTGRLRAVLAAAREPLSIDAIWAALGNDRKASVRNMLGQLVRLGEVVSLKTGPRCQVYMLRAKWKPAPPPKTSTGSGQIAGPITIPQYRYGSTRLG